MLLLNDRSAAMSACVTVDSVAAHIAGWLNRTAMPAPFHYPRDARASSARVLPQVEVALR